MCTRAGEEWHFVSVNIRNASNSNKSLLHACSLCMHRILSACFTSLTRTDHWQLSIISTWWCVHCPLNAITTQLQISLHWWWKQCDTHLSEFSKSRTTSSSPLLHLTVCWMKWGEINPAQFLLFCCCCCCFIFPTEWKLKLTFWSGVSREARHCNSSSCTHRDWFLHLVTRGAHNEARGIYLQTDVPASSPTK